MSKIDIALLKILKEEIPQRDLLYAIAKIMNYECHFNDPKLSCLSHEELALHIEKIIILGNRKYSSANKMPYYHFNPGLFNKYAALFAQNISKVRPYHLRAINIISMKYDFLIRKAKLKRLLTENIKMTVSVAFALIVLGLMSTGYMLTDKDLLIYGNTPDDNLDNQTAIVETQTIEQQEKLELAQAKLLGKASLKSIFSSYSVYDYHIENYKQIQILYNEANNNIELSTSTQEIDAVLTNFLESSALINTIEEEKLLALPQEKLEAANTINSIFNEYASKLYTDTNELKLNQIKDETLILIEEAKNAEEVKELTETASAAMSKVETLREELAQIPLEEKIAFILADQDITMDQLNTISAIVHAEAASSNIEEENYLDAHAVIEVMDTRTITQDSINVVNVYYPGKGKNIYYQAIAPNQFVVYQEGTYTKYLGVRDTAKFEAVINYLYSKKRIHPNYQVRFVSKDSKHPEDAYQIVPGKGNWYYYPTEPSERIEKEPSLGR